MKAREAGEKVTYLTNLYEWMTEQWQAGIVKGQKLFRTKKKTKLYRDMIAYNPGRLYQRTCLEGQLWVKVDKKPSATFLEKSWELIGIKVKEAVMTGYTSWWERQILLTPCRI